MSDIGPFLLVAGDCRLWRDSICTFLTLIGCPSFVIVPQGCYIGQESISRVNAYNAVKNGLFGVSFEEPGVPEGARLVAEETGKR